MCQLLGFTSNKPYGINRLLKAFFEDSNINPHGWGLALVNPDRKFDLFKEPIAAHQSDKVTGICESLLSTNIVIAHIRYMTRGMQELVNTHPFSKKARHTDWVLAHNGTIDYPFYFASTKNKPLGSTDSERILCLLVEKLKNSKSKDIKVIEDTFALLSKFGKLNVLLSDGTCLYVYTNKVGTLFHLKFNNCTIFSTKPLALNKGIKFGRKKIAISESFKSIYADWKQNNITAVEAMKRLGMKSNTFYRRVKEYEMSLK